MVGLSLLFEIPGTIFIAAVFVPVYDVNNFEICLSFLLTTLSYITKKGSTKMKIS